MPVKPTYPGVYIQEERSGVQSIAGVSTSIGAFFGTAPKGPIGEPVRIFSYANFEERFGNQTTHGEMPLQVRQFFLNGGSTAWIMRLASGAVGASATLKSESGFDVLTLTARDAGVAGNTIQVEIDYDTGNPHRFFNLTAYRRSVDNKGKEVISDAESFSNLTMNADHSNYVVKIIENSSVLITADVDDAVPTISDAESTDKVGSSMSGWLFTSDPPLTAKSNVLSAIHDSMPGGTAPNRFGRFRISVNGSLPVEVQLNEVTDFVAFENAAKSSINNALAAAEISASVSVEVKNESQNGTFSISSANGAVEITSATSDDLAAPFKLGVFNGGIETDMFSNKRPAPSGLSARLHGVSSVEAVGCPDFAKIWPLIRQDSKSFGKFSFTPGTASTATYLPFTTPLSEVAERIKLFEVAGTPRPIGAKGSFVEFAQNLTVLARQVGSATSQEWSGDVHGLALVIRSSSSNPLLGRGSKLSSNGPTNIADSIFKDETGRSPANNVSYLLGLTPGSSGNFNAGGNAGSDGAVPVLSDYITAFDRLDREADLFNIVVLPRSALSGTTQTDAERASLWGPVSAKCRDSRAFLVVDPPSDSGAWGDVNAADAGTSTFRTGIVGDLAAVYWPRLKVSDDRGVERVVDPSGSIAGLYARTDVGRGVWKAPAGIGATLTGVRGVEHNITDNENGVTNLAAVNTNRLFPQGVVCWGSRTIAGFENSGEDDWRYIPVRRLALMIEESLYRGLKFAVFEPNDEPLWAQIRLAAGAFMSGLFRQGAFKGSKSSDAYFVACDATTTTQADTNLGIVNVRVGFAPLKPAEFVIVTIRQLAGQIDI